MGERNIIGRRTFLKGMTTTGAPAMLAQANPNEKIGVAAIGVGTRGHYLLAETQKVPNAEIRVICDLYEGNLKRSKDACTNPKVKITKEWEKAIADPDVDAVIIATPDFWHAPMTIRAAQAKKHVYVEKGLCKTLDEAKAIRKAVKENGVVLQLGHHYNSEPPFHKAREIYRSGQLGKVAVIRTYIDRTRIWPEWQFFTDYDIVDMPKDAGPQTIDWDRFVANAPKRPFDARRFFLWRMYWDYGNGIAGDLLSHLWDSVNMVASVGIPETCVAQGGSYFWQDEREVPDQWNAIFDYPKQKLSVSFNCTFSNRHYGEVCQYLGREKTLEVSPMFCRTFPAEWKPENAEKMAKQRRAILACESDREGLAPDYCMKPGELQVTPHWQDWLDSIRTRSKPRCDVDRAFEEAVAMLMSVESYKQEKKVRWDAGRELIV